jgi:hypothetical protein
LKKLPVHEKACLNSLLELLLLLLLLLLLYSSLPAAAAGQNA